MLYWPSSDPPGEIAVYAAERGVAVMAASNSENGVEMSATDEMITVSERLWNGGDVKEGNLTPMDKLTFDGSRQANFAEKKAVHRQRFPEFFTK